MTKIYILYSLNAVYYFVISVKIGFFRLSSNMKRENLHSAFEIGFSRHDSMRLKEHGHTFFELVYIFSGTGLQWINGNCFPYHDGHLFMITPGDTHSFEIHTPTEFVNIRFNDIYVHSSVFGAENIRRLEFILQHANHRPGCILRNTSDKRLVKPLVEAIVREQTDRKPYGDEIVAHCVNTIIVVVARNIAMFMSEGIDERADTRTLDILRCIQSSIYETGRVRACDISRRFGIAASYLGRYMKRHTGETLQEYVARYRLMLVENRLLHSRKRVGEIADELGFADESHLNKFFRKHRGCSPTEWRRNPAIDKGQIP